MILSHSLPAESFEQLSAGWSDEATVRRLLAAQLSKHLLLATHVLRDRLNGDTSIRQTVDALSHAQEEAPQASAAVLRQGWFGCWVSRCLEGMEDGADLTPYFQRLGNIAAAAAWQAGIDAIVEIAVHDGKVHLPTLGTAVLDEETGVDRSATLIIHARQLHLDLGDGLVALRIGGDGRRWLSLRQLDLGSAEQSLRLVIDDLDPLRDCYASPPADRLTREDYHRWWSRAQTAWSLLNTHMPRSSAVIRYWTHTLVPLAPAAEDANLSISSRDALSSVAMSLPPSAPEFAVALVHEQAHAMLNGLMLFARLADPAATDTYFAPWRTDPRPIHGVLHGIYAFTAVAEVWQQLLSVPNLRSTAEDQLARRRVQLRAAIEGVADSPELSSAGHFVLANCRRRLRRLEAAILPNGVQRRATDDLAQRYTRWLERSRPTPT